MDWKRSSIASARASGPHHRERHTPRIEVSDRTQLRHRYSVDVTERDVSARGFMAECDDAVEIGSHVSLEVPGIGPVQAQVRWQIGHRMGGMFLDPISLQHCEWVAVRAGPDAEAC